MTEKFIKGIIERKIPLSLTEQLGEEKENEEITFNVDDISSIVYIGGSKRAIYLKTPPFENTEDFHIVSDKTEVPELPSFIEGIFTQRIQPSFTESNFMEDEPEQQKIMFDANEISSYSDIDNDEGESVVVLKNPPFPNDYILICKSNELPSI